MAQQDTNQLIQEDPTTQPEEPLVGTADTSTGLAAVQPVTTQTEPPPAPPPSEAPTMETEGVKTTTTRTFDPTLEIPEELKAITPEQTVAGQIEKITAAESPLMIAARTRAEQAAAQRGLGMSTLAIEAGQKALYDAALPIAEADAATAADRANQLLDSYVQSGISAQEATQQSELLVQEAVNKGLLSQQEAAQAIEHIQVAGQIAQDQSILDDRLKRDTDEYLARLEAELADEATAKGVYDQYSTAVQDLVTTRSNIINNIQAQPGLSASEKLSMISAANTQFDEDLNNLNELYATHPEWDDEWSMVGTGGTAIEGSLEAGAVEKQQFERSKDETFKTMTDMVGRIPKWIAAEMAPKLVKEMISRAAEVYGRDSDIVKRMTAWWRDYSLKQKVNF